MARPAKSRTTQYLYLTTTGRRTGQPREIEIWFTQRGGLYYLVAEHRERAQWVRNLRLAPRVAVRVRGRWHRRARRRRERRSMLGAWQHIGGRAVERLGRSARALARAVAPDCAARRRAARRLFPHSLACWTQLRPRGIPLPLVT